jgi:hypothetical protein
LQLTATQFAIRYAEHQATCRALLERGVTGAGYSPQTFGLDADAALTATESWARQKRTRDTRAGKIRRWRPAIIQLVKIMLAVDRVLPRQRRPRTPPRRHVPRGRIRVQLQMAQSASLMRTAEAASTETLVRMLHGDWDDEAVKPRSRRSRTRRGGDARAALGGVPRRHHRRPERRPERGPERGPAAGPDTGTDVFNVAGGAATGTITLLNQAAVFQYRASGAIWYATGDDIPLSQLDLRFLAISTAIPESQVTGLVSDLAAKAPKIDRNQFASGEAVLDRYLGQKDTFGAAGSGTLLLTYFTAQRTESITQIRCYVGGTAAGATPTLCRFGIWSVSASDDSLTALLASTANDTTLFGVANTAYTKTLGSTFNKVVDTRYAVGVLVVSAAAIPAFMGCGVANGALDAAALPRLSAFVSSQSDLPSTVAAGSLTASTRIVQYRLLP